MLGMHKALRGVGETDLWIFRRNIAHVLKVIWDNPVHREALNVAAK